METIKDFLSSNGISESDIILDGSFKELKTNNFKGWYIGDSLGEGKRSITIEDWRTRDRKSFIEGVDLTDPSEKQKLVDIREKYEREKLELQILKQKFAVKRLAKFREESWPEFSQYLADKKITKTFGALQVQSSVERTDLIIPMYDRAGALWNYQTIQDSGPKSFVVGALVEGLFYELHGSVSFEEILITEGFATACSVKMALPHVTVVCAFMASNLQSVAESMRIHHPTAKIIICGDDDYKRDPNTGKEYAEKAAKSIAGSFVLPIFPTIRGKDDTDYNDLHQRYSVDMVRDQLTQAINSCPRPSKMWSEAFMESVKIRQKETKSAQKAAEKHLIRADSLNVIDPYSNGVQPLEMRISKTGQPILPPEFTVADALFKYYEGRTVVSESSIFIYEGTHWKEVDEFNEGKIMVQLQVLYNGLATNGKLKGTYEQFKNLLPKAARNLFLPTPYIVNLQNGTIHIEKQAERWKFRFAEHCKDDFCTHVIPINYDETRKIRNEEFESMISRICGSDQDGIEKARAIKQMYGACVAPIFPHLFMLFGPAASGKTSLIIPAMRLAHSDNLASVEPHEFDKPFGMESMVGKLVNIVTDIDLTKNIADNHIKKIEDRMPIRIDRKFKKAALASLPAIHIFGGNDIPPTYEKGSNAHQRRWTFVHIEGLKISGNYSKNFANDTFDSNPVGILNWALDGLLEILNDNGHYFVPETGKEKMKKWEMIHDPVALFFHEILDGEDFGLKLQEEGRLDRTYLWATFVGWYRHSYNAPPKLGKNKFFEAVCRGTFSERKIALVKIEGVFKFAGLRKTDTVPPWPIAAGGSGH